MIIQEKDYLIHSGVKGMKWGQHKNKNKSTYIKKGTTVHHVSKNNKIELSNKRIYASYKVKDLQRYQYVAGKMWATKKLYDHAYTTNETLKVPSKKQQTEIYNELAKNNKDIKKTLEKFVGEKIDKTLDMKEVYEELLSYKNPPLMDEYKSIAKRLGYNAVVDYNDKGRNSESPIIILDAKKSLSQTKVTELDPKNIALGKKYVDELRSKL